MKLHEGKHVKKNQKIFDFLKIRKVQCTKINKAFRAGPCNEGALDKYYLMAAANEDLRNKHMDEMIG